MGDTAFSGCLVPIQDLPSLMRMLAQIVPPHHFLTVIPALMLKGAIVGDVWQHTAIMVLTGLIGTAVAVRNLSRSLD